MVASREAADDGQRRQAYEDHQHERGSEERPEASHAGEDVAHVRLPPVPDAADDHAVQTGEQRSGEDAQREDAERARDQAADEQRSDVLDEQSPGPLEGQADVEAATSLSLCRCDRTHHVLLLRE